MPYCSLEEAWGSDFKDSSYFSQVNAAPASSSVQNTVPGKLAQKGLEMGDNSVPQEKSDLDKYFPSYSGGAPSVAHIQSAKSKIVPYQVSFPDRAKRNYTYPVENVIQDDDSESEDSALDLLEDNENDTRYIDKQRRVKPNYEPDYLTSEDYFLYKKYLSLAQKYKEKLKKRYKNFIDEEPQYKNVLESFGNMQTNNYQQSYSMKDMIIIIIVGIFLIFALDIFVKLGARTK